jgi:hypothetical protein
MEDWHRAGIFLELQIVELAGRPEQATQARR